MCVCPIGLFLYQILLCHGDSHNQAGGSCGRNKPTIATGICGRNEAEWGARTLVGGEVTGWSVAGWGNCQSWRLGVQTRWCQGGDGWTRHVGSSQARRQPWLEARAIGQGNSSCLIQSDWPWPVGRCHHPYTYYTHCWKHATLMGPMTPIKWATYSQPHLYYKCRHTLYIIPLIYSTSFQEWGRSRHNDIMISKKMTYSLI